MNYIVGILWFKDELTYLRALEMFVDSDSMPATFAEWKSLVEKQLAEIKGTGNRAIRADFHPETFLDWCLSRGFQPNSQARTAFAEHVVLEYEKTGKGTFIE